ncbi:MAG: hypothetical protein ACJAZY_001565 [Spirosomataceae bacterium]|jgi:hypothetical protein
MGFFGTTPLSWRVLEEHYKGTLFQKRFSPTSNSIDHSSISERLEKMPIEFFEQVYYSEDIALTEVISETSFKKNNVLVFDRGLSGKQKLKKLTLDNISFVGRLKTNTAFQECESLPFTKPQKKESDTVEILGDSLIHRMANFRKSMDVPFRLVICGIKETGEEMYLITNMLNVSALEVADIYKLRWDIELFFRFLKQDIHFEMHVSQITTSMIYVYRRVNEIEGFKIAKMRFQNELIEGLIEILGKVNENQNQTIENLAAP